MPVGCGTLRRELFEVVVEWVVAFLESAKGFKVFEDVGERRRPPEKDADGGCLLRLAEELSFFDCRECTLRSNG